MVSAGRELLKKAAYAAPTMSENGAPTYQVWLLTQMLAEKRQKLYDQLHSLDEKTEAIMPLGSQTTVLKRAGKLQTFLRRTGMDLGFSSKSSNKSSCWTNVTGEWGEVRVGRTMVEFFDKVCGDEG
eukprot:1626169-Ditylum_brightwellii.AAC.1